MVVNIIVSTKSGTIYHEDITYGGEGSNKNKDADMQDEKDEDNS